MHSYLFHIGDYMLATAHLSPLEDLAYRRLLDLYYDTEEPIPVATQSVAKRLRLGVEEVELVLREFFTETENGWRHERCDIEIHRYRQICERNRENGKLGGRGQKTQSEPSGLPNAKRSVSGRSASAKRGLSERSANHKPEVNPSDDSNGHGFKYIKNTEVEAESHERGRVAQAMPENEQEPVPWPDDDDPPPEHPYTSREADPENPHSSRLPPRREVGPRPPDDPTFPLKHVSGHYGKVLARLEAQAAEREAKRKAQGGAE